MKIIKKLFLMVLMLVSLVALFSACATDVGNSSLENDSNSSLSNQTNDDSTGAGSSGKKTTGTVPLYNDNVFLVDISDSNYCNASSINKYINNLLENKPKDYNVQIYGFGCGTLREILGLSSGEVPNVDCFANDAEDFVAQSESGYVRASGSDIAGAVDFAVKKFSKKDLSDCRIVIFSDGVETDGKLKNAVTKYATRGLTVDVVYFQAESFLDKNEMLINDFTISNSTISTGENFDVKVKVLAYAAGSASIQLYDYADVDRKEVALGDPVDFSVTEQEVGKNKEVAIPNVKLNNNGMHPLKVVLTVDNDFLNASNYNDYSENNTFYNFAIVNEQSNKILIIDGTGTGAIGLINLIDKQKDASNKYKVDVITPTQAPTDLSDYGEVILLDVDSRQFPLNYDTIIERYVKNGGGLLTMCGEHTFYYGSMGSNRFANVLPIGVKPEVRKTKAVMLCIDYSSGMAGGDGCTNLNYQGAIYTPAELIAKGLKKALTSGAFSEDDYVGILLFGGKGDEMMPIILPITPASEVLDIYNAISKIDPNVTRAIGNNEWRRPLEKATELLRAYPQGDTKHIIFITDGTISENFIDGEGSKNFSYNGMVYHDGGWKQYGETLNSSVPADKQNVCYTGYIYDKYEITTSSMWVFTAASDTVKGYIKQMATDGHGRFYDLTTPEQIAEAVDKEVKAIPGSDNEIDFKLQVISSVSLETGVSSVDLPVLKGYNGCQLKDGATSYIETDNNPVYASWKYGAGSSGALMTDITNANWAKDFADDAEGQKLLKWMVDDNFSIQTSALAADAEYSFERENFTTTIRVSEIANARIDYMEAAALDQNSGIDVEAVNKSYIDIYRKINELVPYDSSVILHQAMGAFVGELITTKPGVYTVTFYRGETSEDGTKVDPLDTFIPYTYICVNYSKEYLGNDNPRDIQEFLQDTVGLTNGKFYFSVPLDKDGYTDFWKTKLVETQKGNLWDKLFG